ncbi:hypothetical protein Y013_24680 (plasmid) [Rhodococcus pyridinivorans SB3094]|uniref:Uncharacterized protein n=1 Tax=Rhodococcus pyridinivorans SB3094 TaxID=1435356 RepID=V9XQ92_9NOCA|nr:hypothetical protein Y013_24680 [Rhodococcus pyridinivorans SB3094]
MHRRQNAVAEDRQQFGIDLGYMFERHFQDFGSTGICE